MTTTIKILFIGLLIIGTFLWIAYTYVALWLIPRNKEGGVKFNWYAMLFASTGTLSLLLSWILVEPLAKDFLIVFFIFSLIIGYLARESAISPIKLAEFWSRLGRSKNNKDDIAGSDNDNQVNLNALTFLCKYKFMNSLVLSLLIVGILKFLDVRLPYIITFALLFILANICIDILASRYHGIKK